MTGVTARVHVGFRDNLIDAAVATPRAEYANGWVSTHWTCTSGTLSATPTSTPAVAWNGWSCWSVIDVSSGGQYAWLTSRPAVTVGTDYEAMLYLCPPAGRTVSALLRFYDSGGTVIPGGDVTLASTGTHRPGWYLRSGHGVAPSGAVTCSPVIGVTDAVAGDDLYWAMVTVAQYVAPCTGGANLPGIHGPLHDVTAYWEAGRDITMTHGRSDVESEVATGRLTGLVLNNADGRFSVGYASSPYYPSVVPKRPIRVSVLDPSGVPIPRWNGYVDGWPLRWEDNGTACYVEVSASDAIGESLTGITYEPSGYAAAKVRGNINATATNSRATAYWPADSALDVTVESVSLCSDVDALGSGAVLYSGPKAPVAGTVTGCPVAGAGLARQFIANSADSYMHAGIPGTTTTAWWALAFVSIDTSATDNDFLVVHRGTATAAYPGVGVGVSSAGYAKLGWYSAGGVYTNWWVDSTCQMQGTGWHAVLLGGDPTNKVNCYIWRLPRPDAYAGWMMANWRSSHMMTTDADTSRWLSQNSDPRSVRIGTRGAVSHVVVGSGTVWYARERWQGMVESEAADWWSSIAATLNCRGLGVGGSFLDVTNLEAPPSLWSPTSTGLGSFGKWHMGGASLPTSRREEARVWESGWGGIVVPHLDTGGLRFMARTTPGVALALDATEVAPVTVESDHLVESQRVRASSALGSTVVSIAEAGSSRTDSLPLSIHDDEPFATSTTYARGAVTPYASYQRHMGALALRRAGRLRIPRLSVDAMLLSSAKQESLLHDVRVWSVLGLSGLPTMGGLATAWPLRVEGWTEQVGTKTWVVDFNVEYAGRVLGDSTFRPMTSDDTRLG